MSPRRLGGMPLLGSKGMRMFWTSPSSPGPSPSRRAARTTGPLHWECVRSACQGLLGALPLARFCSGRCATEFCTSRETRGSHADFVLRGPEAGHDIRPDFATRAITTTFAMRAINSYTLRSRTRASASARSLSRTFAFPSSCCRAWRQCVSVRLEVVHPQAQAPLEAFPLGVGEECAPRTARSTSVGAFLLRAVCDGYP